MDVARRQRAIWCAPLRTTYIVAGRRAGPGGLRRPGRWPAPGRRRRSAIPAHPPLYGRAAEQAAIDRVLEEAAVGRSGLLLLHGEPGAGKSALLGHARQRAAAHGMQCVQARGAVSESEYAFAGLHQLLHPLLRHLSALPGAQAKALAGALRLGADRVEDRFLVSVAVLSLLTEASAGTGLVCVLDDVQWLDRPTMETLLFVARRIRTERVAVFLGQRDPVPDPLSDPWLPRLRLGGLDEGAAGQLLAAGRDVPDAAVVRELVARTRGNPLALTELGEALAQDQLCGREPLPVPLPLGAGVERAFLDRVRALPDATQLALVVAAAEETGDLSAVVAALERLGLSDSSLDAAADAGLVSVRGGHVEFHHPVVRTAVYSGSGFTRRRRVHAALAEALLPQARDGRRAWHLASAALGPDETVAAELADAAEHARARGGYASASALLERAARLTPDVDVRAGRLYETARATWEAGRARHTEELIAEAELIARGPALLGRLLQLRGAVQMRSGVITDAYRTLSRAADCFAESEPSVAARCLVQAAEAASYSGDLRRFGELGATAARLASDEPAVHCTHLLLSGVGAVVEGDVGAGRELVTRGIEEAVALEDPMLVAWAGNGALFLGEAAQAMELFGRVGEPARTSGHVGALPSNLHFVVILEMLSGRTAHATSLADEGFRLARETGQENLEALHLSRLAFLHAMRGNEDACREAAQTALHTALRRRIGLAVATAHHALAALALIRGEYPEALHMLEALASAEPGTGHPVISLLSLPDRIEAAIHAGEPEAARTAMQELESWQAGAVTGEARALLARSRALLEPDDDRAVVFFEEALALHSGSVPAEKARTELYFGERLRRIRKRVYARRCLRSAADTLERLNMWPWAERAQRELRATGEARRRTSRTADLTPQELRIARLAAQGLSNREIAGQLFLSRRTVEYHLYKVFPKLSVASRADLTRLYYADPSLFE
ncbi:ATP-binding protein [Streptomyces sp. NPDC012935]|uniref:ATP-binding protein n=1 Tax=Streptomyces sp. NPDC012935 TaxID=3364857 RepID=UPI00368913C1